MYSTISIILPDNSELQDVFTHQCEAAKLFKNSCIYRLRQLFFMWKKDYLNLSDQEKEVLAEFKTAGIDINKKHSLPSYNEFDKMFKKTNNPDYFNDLPMQAL